MGSDIGRNRSRSRRSRSRTESQRHVTTPQGESLVCHSDGQEMTMGVRDWACSNSSCRFVNFSFRRTCLQCNEPYQQAQLAAQSQLSSPRSPRHRSRSRFSTTTSPGEARGERHPPARPTRRIERPGGPSPTSCFWLPHGFSPKQEEASSWACVSTAAIKTLAKPAPETS